MSDQPKDPLCGQVEASCICVLGPDHDGPHVCSCRGSWHYDDDGEFCADAFPQGLGLMEAIGSYLGAWPR